jgi:hypothetical protein
MQNPTDQAEAEASIPTATTVTSIDPSWNLTVMVRRKAAKRSLPFDLAAGELLLEPSSSLSPSPQAEDIPAARKKQRIEEPLTIRVDEAATQISPPDAAVSLPAAAAAAAAADNDDPNADPVTDTQPNDGATRVTRHCRHWTLIEDARLTSAVTSTSKKKLGKEYRNDWAAVAALVPGRRKNQCRGRWEHLLHLSIDRANERTGKWSEDEDI